MAKSKPAPARSAKQAKVPARSKTVAHAGASKARKTPPKSAAKAKRPVAAAKKPANKPVAKTVKPPVKAAPKAAAPKPVQAKNAPATKKPAVASKQVTQSPQSSNLEKQSGKSVSTSKPATSAAATVSKGAKARAVAPAADSGVTMQDGRYALPTTVRIELPNGYKPTGKEEYMSPRQLEYFRRKLGKWREELVEESRQTIESLRDEVRDVGDEAERATRETENSLELRTRDRYRKLIAKIDKALKRIEEGRYGYCEETDEEIGLERLEARPIATLSLDAQERWEHRQKQMGD
jgi:RNA polymerase-binding transcription factor